MNPLLIASIAVVAIASLVIWAVNYASKRKRQLAPVHLPAQWLAGSDEGSVVFPVRAAETAPANVRVGKQALATSSREQRASALDHQVDDVISRFILKS